MSSTSTTSARQPWHKGFDPAREDQTCTLPDGRKLGFAEYGSPSGTPLFLFHGAPGTRWDGIGYEEESKLLDVRIICPDRPGHGLSSPQPNRKILDYPADISALARHLGINKYHIAGQSGGGPYVSVCAYASPEDELLNSTIIAGMIPPEGVSAKSAGYYTTAVLALYRLIPNTVIWLTDYFYPPSFWADDKKVQRQLDFAYKFLPKEDKDEIARPSTQPAIRAILREAFRQGSAGVVQDAIIFGQPYGFELKDVKRHIKLFYGREDNRTPPAFGEYYHKHLPSSALTIMENKSHFRLDDVSLDMIAAAVGKEDLITPEMRKTLAEKVEEIKRDGP